LSSAIVFYALNNLLTYLDHNAYDENIVLSNVLVKSRHCIERLVTEMK